MSPWKVKLSPPQREGLGSKDSEVVWFSRCHKTYMQWPGEHKSTFYFQITFWLSTYMEMNHFPSCLSFSQILLENLRLNSMKYFNFSVKTQALQKKSIINSKLSSPLLCNTNKNQAVFEPRTQQWYLHSLQTNQPVQTQHLHSEKEITSDGSLRGKWTSIKMNIIKQLVKIRFYTIM